MCLSFRIHIYVCSAFIWTAIGAAPAVMEMSQEINEKVQEHLESSITFE